MRLKRALAGGASIAIAVFAFSSCGEETGWRCCQTTALTCACSENRACDSDAIVDRCSVDELDADEAYCCHHTNIASCSCSEDASDIAGEPVCSREGDVHVEDCSVEPSGEGVGGAAGAAPR